MKAYHLVLFFQGMISGFYQWIILLLPYLNSQSYYESVKSKTPYRANSLILLSVPLGVLIAALVYTRKVTVFGYKQSFRICLIVMAIGLLIGS
jgi:hypothetical protein